MHASTQTAERPVLYIYSMHKIAHYVETCPSQNYHSPPPRTRFVRELTVFEFRETSSLLFRKYVFCEKKHASVWNQKKSKFYFQP
jgi:hypothetical protein